MISPAVDQFFPKIKVKMSSNDSAFISPRVKLLLKKRRILIQKGMVLEADSLQVTIDNLIQQNQIIGVKSKNNKHCKSTRQWWKTVNTISGRESKNVSLSSLLALEEVNKYLQVINSDANYKAPCCVNVPQGTRLPAIDGFTTFKFLSQRKITAAGPDDLSHWF